MIGLNRLKKLVLRVAPEWCHEWLRWVYFGFKLSSDYLYDFRRYLRYSGLNKSYEYFEEHSARVTMAYHQLEKGLSYKYPRPGFGVQVVGRLFDACDRFVAFHGVRDPVTVALGVICRYVLFNESAGVDMCAVRRQLNERVVRWGVEFDPFEIPVGGVRSISREDLLLARRRSFKDFFESRHSVRNFDHGIVPRDVIEAAVSLARKTPSVCNRQTVRVHCFTKRDDLARILAIQAGSRGFGDEGSALLVVTSDLAAFVDSGERYQAWIDGGMFSMSLCLALHDQGYGSCCLNWSKTASEDKRLREEISLPVSEQVVMMIIVGVLPENFSVAFSARRSLATVLTWH